MPFTGSLIFSHILPGILGFFGILFLINGIMDNDKIQTVIGVMLFLSAGILPFIVLSFIL